MSEQTETEHTTEESEAETHVQDRNEQSKSESSMLNNQTGVAMLEDEEMPTYISVSSPSRREDTSASTAKQQERIAMEDDRSQSPYRSDDQDADSVCVLSSEEDSNHPPYSDDDDEDDYKDSDEMDEEEEEEDEEEEEEEARLRMPDDEDDEFDCDYEPDYNDRASDDLLLTNRLKKEHKEKSLSLQDLSICKSGSPMLQSRKRLSLNILRQNQADPEHNAMVYAMINRKPPGMFRNNSVKSKVKLYIENLKEQSRKSLERRTKVQETHLNKNHMENENAESEQQPRSTSGPRIIKDYAEKVLKDLQSDENEENDNRVYNTERVVENGNENECDLKATQNEHANMETDVEVDVYCESVQNNKNEGESDPLLDKQNGTVDTNVCDVEQNNFFDPNIKVNNVNDAGIVNGHQSVPTYFDVRTLTYEEYMRGVPNNYEREEKRQQPEVYEEMESRKMIVTNEPSSKVNDEPQNVGNGKQMEISIDEEKGDIKDRNFTKSNQNKKLQSENIEIMNLKAQLSQKTIECNNLHDAYQKTVAENLRMKQEIEMLKNSLTKQENEKKTRKTNVASIQTDEVVESTKNEEVKRAPKESNNKISTSSVASTISSIEQWADSACSPAISIKPPELTALNSDDSMVLTNGTPRKPMRPSLSKAFITSSRILQTLSTIAHGKSNANNTPVNNSKKQSSETLAEHRLLSDYNSPIQASSSKKRKATDMLGASTFLQPFKIPHTLSESHRRRRSSIVDTEAKHLEERIDLKSEDNIDCIPANAKTSNSESSGDMTKDIEDQDPNVKCFVYREDESSEDHSFLIQTDGALDDQPNQKGRIRECGPYLLGNVEVRMSDVNGTISIWGKEVSQESAIETERVEESEKEPEEKACPCWEKTAQLRLNGSPLVCSTSKKPKVSIRSNSRNSPQYMHPSSSRVAFVESDSDEHVHVSSCNRQDIGPSCENSDAATHCKRHSAHKHLSSSCEKLHSCCTNHVESTERECNAHQNRLKFSETPNCSKDKYVAKYNRRSLNRNTPDRNKHLCESMETCISDVEIACKHNTCRSSAHSTEAGYQQHAKCCSTVRDVPHRCKLSSANTSGHDNTKRHSCNYSPFHDDDEEPLISHKHSHESPEVRQRRLRGKKVRGILMDLFRGCGDCRSSNITAGGKSSSRRKESSYSNSVPEIKVTQCDGTEASCSNTAQPGGRCCRSYAQRIESQLEEFRMEMERVRSRSDAILDMLSMLHSVDMN